MANDIHNTKLLMVVQVEAELASLKDEKLKLEEQLATLHKDKVSSS